MRNHTELLDIAYKYLEEKKKSSFKDIWNYVKKELNVQPEEEEKVVGNLYTGMVLDPHFFLKNDKLWYTRDQVTLEEFKSQIAIIKEEDPYDSDYTVEEESSLTTSFDEDLIPLEDEYEDGDKEVTNDIDVVYKRVLNKEFNE